MNRKLIFVLTFILVAILALKYTESSNPKVLSVSDSSSIFEKFLPALAKNQRQKHFDRIVSEIGDKQGTYALYIKKVNTDETYMYNPETYFYAASLYKAPIAVAALKEVQDGKRTLEDTQTYYAIDYSDGTGTINLLGSGAEFTLDYTLDRLLKDSDNTGQNILLRILETQSIINAFNLAAENSTFYNTNDATVVQLGDFFFNLKTQKYLDKQYFDTLVQKMAQTSFDDRINVGLESGTIFAHKIGNWGDAGSWHDCGYAIKEGSTVIVCLMSKNTTYIEFLDISRITGEFANLLF